ncbi:glycosyltransferase [Roseobacter sp. OBYS 0001]|uniref:glycosyltransferase family 2 protein n=1 Tax=Roseobacter sp. OBYS 0001 TaxID=882651 RepID=UPI001BC7EB6B|nr:glycosyltransferase [Roseobacter sp. OBYS 0001]GIT89247.1 hypothetical protein ROBYS_42630 [Roseobacter sp. OBYS 0001]
MNVPVAIIIPAHNEAHYIEACLNALVAQDDTAGAMRVIVAANACTDATVSLARAKANEFEKRDSRLEVLDLPNPGKTAALNAAEKGLEPGLRIYLDADIICDPDLIGQIRSALSPTKALYATGSQVVSTARTFVTRAYADLWQQLPFFKDGTTGAGLFALNAEGRRRWQAFPAIISDDTFVRLNFAPSERIEVPARYHWPMIEGFSNLAKVRRRQDAGVAEIRSLYPELLENDHTEWPSLRYLLALALRKPLSFAVYLAVHIAVRVRRPASEWTRGR